MPIGVELGIAALHPTYTVLGKTFGKQTFHRITK